MKSEEEEEGPVERKLVYSAPIYLDGNVALYYQTKDGQTQAVFEVAFQPIGLSVEQPSRLTAMQKPVVQEFYYPADNLKLGEIDADMWARFLASQIASVLPGAALRIAAMLMITTARVVGKKSLAKNWLQSRTDDLVKYLRTFLGEKTRPGPQGLILRKLHVLTAIRSMA